MGRVIAGKDSMDNVSPAGSVLAITENSHEQALVVDKPDKYSLVDESMTLPISGAEANAKRTPAKKPKLIRDSFTFPESDYALIAQLKMRAMAAGRDTKKSEVVRAALATLASLPAIGLLQALDGLEKLTPGRPAR